MSGHALGADLIVAWFDRAATVIHENRDLLTQLDSERGDADHGTNMDSGFSAIRSQLDAEPPANARAAMSAAARVIRRGMGGTSGALWASALRRAANALPDHDPFDEHDLAQVLRALGEAMQELGGAREGQNTGLDALLPASRAFEDSDLLRLDLSAAVRAAADAAAAGARATAGRVAELGRASYLGERGIAAQDPGATSAALVIRALAEVTT